jgi:folate-binding protein YgfZ
MKPYLAFSRTTLAMRDGDHVVVGLVGDQQPCPWVIDDDETLRNLSTTHRMIGETDFRLACIDAGSVLISQATSEQFLPQMLGLVEIGAVDFDKGCYLGQEVVARAQHRGEVKRKLHRFSGSLPAPESGARLIDGSGRESGTLVQVAACTDATGTGSGDGYRCLAVVREPVDSKQTSDHSVLALES